MPARFKDYLEAFCPRLNDSCDSRLSSLLGGLESNGLADFRSALSGGKRIRGCLLFMVNDVLGGSWDSALPRAVAIELIHTASLIHDDFVDQHATRRGMPAIWTFEGARRAVLLGDLIFASAIEMMSELSQEDGRVVSRAIAQVARGAFSERLDPSMLAREIESGQFDETIYQEIISLKTGILFAAACRLGAVCAGANSGLKEDLFQYGNLIGEAYQIADDLQEIKHHLLTRSIHRAEMSALTPTLCYFARGSLPHVLPILAGRSTELSEAAMELFLGVERVMEEEIEKRLDAAVSKVAGHFGKSAASALMREAPRDLIGRFNES